MISNIARNLVHFHPEKSLGKKFIHKIKDSFGTEFRFSGPPPKEYVYKVFEKSKELKKKLPGLDFFDHLPIEHGTDLEFIKGFEKFGYHPDDLHAVYMKYKVRENPENFQIASDADKSNKSLILKLLKITHEIIKYISDDLKNDLEFVDSAIKSNFRVVKYVNQSEELMYAQIKENLDAYLYIKVKLAQNWEFMKSLDGLHEGLKLDRLRSDHEYAKKKYPEDLLRDAELTAFISKKLGFK